MKRFEKQILVTRPYFPSLESFKKGLEEIWHNQWLTNNGPVLKRFQAQLAAYLGVSDTNLALFSNGTLALEIGFQVLGLAGGDVITTPFTFVATSHALKRIGANPIFADIDPETMCLSPEAAEKYITPRTKAIVPVHVYGHPCDVEGFEALGKKYGLKIIYDAAHAFGVKLGGNSIATYGDMSMFSLHSTKLFHSAEGGLLVFKDPAIQARVYELRNFAIHSELECTDVGTNAKMNEMQALMGCECLKAIDALLDSRRMIHETYQKAFAGCPDVLFPNPANFKLFADKGFEPNYAYCPTFFKDEATREKVYKVMKEQCNVFSRRYFYPLLTDFAPYIYGRGSCRIAENMGKRVLTLPTYYGLTAEDATEIANNVLEIVK